jgi:Protein of unknown function (DUF669)
VAKKIRIDFGGVEKEIRRGGGRVRVPEGDYILKIVDASEETGERSGAKYLRWTFQVHEGTHKGKKLRMNTSLKPDALWNLRNLIHAALGNNVAGKAVNFDPEKLYGKIVGGAVEDNEFNDRITSQVASVFPKDEANPVEDDEEAEEDEDEEEEEEDDDDLEDVEVEDL